MLFLLLVIFVLVDFGRGRSKQGYRRRNVRTLWRNLRDGLFHIHLRKAFFFRLLGLFSALQTSALGRFHLLFSHKSFPLVLSHSRRFFYRLFYVLNTSGHLCVLDISCGLLCDCGGGLYSGTRHITARNLLLNRCGCAGYVTADRLVVIHVFGTSAFKRRLLHLVLLDRFGLTYTAKEIGLRFFGIFRLLSGIYCRSGKGTRNFLFTLHRLITALFQVLYACALTRRDDGFLLRLLHRAPIVLRCGNCVL